MSTDQAQSAVSLSAFVVAAVFGYRKLVEQGIQGGSGVPTTGHFIIGFGFTYVLLSLVAQGAPALGGMMAILVATGDILANGKPLVDDVTKALNATRTATSSSAGTRSPVSFAGLAPATLTVAQAPLHTQG